MAKEKKSGLLEKSEKDIEVQPVLKESTENTFIAEEKNQKMNSDDEGIRTRGYRSLIKKDGE